MRATARSLARSLARARKLARAIKYIRANQDLIALSTANGHNRASTPHVRFDDIIPLSLFFSDAPRCPSPLTQYDARIFRHPASLPTSRPLSRVFFLSRITQNPR